MIIKYYFMAYFVQNKHNGNFQFFDQNHALTLRKKPNMATM